MTSLPQTQLLDLELDRSWLRIYLNDPETRNALTEQLSGELKAVLHAVRSDSRVRGITLRGRNGVFSAGGDLKAFAAIRAMSKDDARDAALAASLDGAELFHLVYTAPQIVVALIEGAAMAGGLGLACAADYAYATSDTKFAFTETRLGLTPAQISPYVINKTGIKTGRHLLLTGAALGANSACEHGLIDELADDPAGLDELEARLIGQIMQCAPGAVGVTKAVIDDAIGWDFEAFHYHAAEHFAECLISDEGREGIRAFFEKRSASWAQDPAERDAHE